MKKGKKTTKKKAAAIGMSKGEHPVPVLLAKGEEELAESILKIAREKGIEVREDQGLIDMLMVLDDGRDIPVEMYKAIVEILACIYSCEQDLIRSSSKTQEI